MYGTKSSYEKSFIVSGRFTVNGKVVASFNDDLSNGFLTVHLSRSGSNGINRYNLKGAGRYRYVYKTVSVPRGPRLPYKIYLPKLRRYVWARKPIQTLRLVREKVASGRQIARDILPNHLNFVTARIKYYGTTQLTGTWVTPFNVQLRSYSSSGPFLGYLRSFDNNQFLGTNPQMWGGASISTYVGSAVSKTDDSALNKFYERAKGQKVNLAQALAERAQTANMFADAIQRAATFIGHIKKGQLHKAAKLLPHSPKGAANDWLLLQYGVKPMLQDLDGMAQELAAPEPISFDVGASEKTELPMKLIHDSQPAPFFRERVYVEGTCIVKYRGRYRIDTVVRDLSRLGFGNLASVLWEVAPYSFIVDWFLPIGDFLNNRDAFSGISPLFSHRTVLLKEKLVFSRTFGGTGPYGYTWQPGVDGFVKEVTSCVRSPLMTTPPLRYPPLKDPVSEGHILNSIALLVQKLK